MVDEYTGDVTAQAADASATEPGKIVVTTDQTAEKPAADAALDDASSSDDGEGGEKHRRSGWARTQSQIRELRESNDRLQRMLETVIARDAPAEQLNKQKDVAPKPEEFQSIEAYVNALVNHRVKEILPAETEKLSAQQQQMREASAYEARANVFRDATPDFDDTLEMAPPVPAAVGHALLADENGPKIAYELARRPDVIHAMAKMTPAQQLMHLGRFAATALAEKPKVSKAPNPATPVAKGPAPGSKMARLGRATTLAGIRAALDE